LKRKKKDLIDKESLSISIPEKEHRTFKGSHFQQSYSPSIPSKMPRKAYIKDLAELQKTGQVTKGDEDGTVNVLDPVSGKSYSIIFISLHEYPNSPVLLTTEDDDLAVQFTGKQDLTGSISQVIGHLSRNGEEMDITESNVDRGGNYPTEDPDDLHVLDPVKYLQCRLDFNKVDLPRKVLAAMNISRNDQLLLCIRIDTICNEKTFRFFLVNGAITVSEEDVRSMFARFTRSSTEDSSWQHANIRKFLFEWTLIDFIQLVFPPRVTFHAGTLLEKVLSRLGCIHTSCIVCHEKFSQDLAVLKPTVCTRDFCYYRFVEYGLSADVAYEIRHSPLVVDMLIQFTFAAATSSEDVLDPFPVMVEKREAPTKQEIADILGKMPNVHQLQEWVDKSELVSQMNAIDPFLFPLLRWILCTNTSFIEEILDPQELILGIPKTYKQFRISSGSLNKEYAFQCAKKKHALGKNEHLYAFHGSSVYNWHSILRLGLHYKKTTNGRAYGNGIYHALDVGTSLSYAGNISKKWENAELAIDSCFTMNELVNCLEKFVSSSPYLVVEDIQWVQLRYLFLRVRGNSPVDPLSARLPPSNSSNNRSNSNSTSAATGSYLPLAMKLVSTNSSLVQIPTAILDGNEDATRKKKISENTTQDVIEPEFATPFASKTIMRDILNFTRNCPPWLTFDENSVENLYRWRVLMKDFPEDLPLSRDLKKKNLSGIILELCFGPSYPIAPPFIRVVSPRMLQFCNGGGGHVTAGGSICMDLLTDSGWLPSYTLESALLQVKMALSAVDPAPARLDTHRSHIPYGIQESWESFTRVARDHGWKVDVDGGKFFTTTGDWSPVNPR
jgi:ubiquitin-protein ligase